MATENREELLLDYLLLTDALVKKAKAEHDRLEAQRRAATEKSARVLDALVRHHKLRPEDREKMAARLQEPALVLDSLELAADPQNVVTAPTLGTAETAKQAAQAAATPAYGRPGPAFVGVPGGRDPQTQAAKQARFSALLRGQATA
jgi:hypothetical protein